MQGGIALPLGAGRQVLGIPALWIVVSETVRPLHPDPARARLWLGWLLRELLYRGGAVTSLKVSLCFRRFDRMSVE
jgi:hypothetical protein